MVGKLTSFNTPARREAIAALSAQLHPVPITVAPPPPSRRSVWRWIMDRIVPPTAVNLP